MLAGEAAKFLGITKMSLSIYEHNGKLLPSFRTPNGRRMYHLKDLEEFKKSGKIGKRGFTREEPENKNIIKPQPGPQEVFLSTPADIAIFGGAAFGGKTWSLLVEPLRHITTTKEFTAVVFRRNTTQIRNPGGLWDESLKIYSRLGGQCRDYMLEWSWENGGKLKMAHLEDEQSIYSWQGSALTLILWDELCQFSQNQFFYLLSRNRSLCGVKPYVRASCNPDADSWVANFLAWWIDQETGYPIPERSGIIRWFIRSSEVLIWGDSKEELIEKYGIPGLSTDHEDQIQPKSLTFISAKLSDNKIGTKADPGYKSNLLALSRVERERLLHGNWKVRAESGMYFKRSDVNIVDNIPDDLIKIVRRWDFASTEPSESNPDPDWTAGVKMAKQKNGRYIVLHVEHTRSRSHLVRELIKRIAVNDGRSVRIGISQDPGQAGVEQAQSYVRDLAGFSVDIIRETGDKVTRADPFAAQWQAGNVDVLRAQWNDDFFNELESFPSKAHDDQVDGASGAFLMLVGDTLGKWARLSK